jgi:hypothetical protein
MKILRDLCSEDKEFYVASLIQVELTNSYMIIQQVCTLRLTYIFSGGRQSHCISVAILQVILSLSQGA